MAVSRWTSTDTTTAAIPAYAGDRVVPVDGVGFGCVVVRVAALRALAAPYFAAHAYVDRADAHRAPVRRRLSAVRALPRRGPARAARTPACAPVTTTAAATRPRRRAWESDAETDRLRMIVLEDGRTKLVPFDDAVPRARERQERFETTILFAG